MSETVKLNNIISSLVDNAPPCELKNISQGLLSILGEQNGSAVNNSLEEFVNGKSGVFFPGYIASNLNKKEGSSKYIDYVGRQLFNIHLGEGKAIDFEDYDPEVEYPSYYEDLVEGLNKYGEDHYPSDYAFTVVPGEDSLHILIIGQRSNIENYYTGQWKSHFIILSGQAQGEMEVDIHYFEEGNVRLQFKQPINGTLEREDASGILNYISTYEDKATLNIIQRFDDLNQKSFKNLRRLLPVTRSKINWGKAIGNYRLGSDVIHKK